MTTFLQPRLLVALPPELITDHILSKVSRTDISNVALSCKWLRTLATPCVKKLSLKASRLCEASKHRNLAQLFPKLTCLEVHITCIHDLTACLPRLLARSHPCNLSSLTISDSLPKDFGAAECESCESYQACYDFSSAILSVSLTVKDLRQFTLTTEFLSDAETIAIGRLRSLTHLDIRTTHGIPADALAELRPLTQLQRLCLADCNNASDADIDAVCQLSSGLTALHLGLSPSLTPKILQHIANGPAAAAAQLTDLSIFVAEGLEGDRSLMEAVAQLTGVRRLVIEGYINHLIPYVSSLTNLQSLDICLDHNVSGLGDHHMQPLAALSACTQLKELLLPHSADVASPQPFTLPSVTHLFLESAGPNPCILSALPSLTHLDINDTQGFKAPWLTAIGKHCPLLKYLLLDSSWGRMPLMQLAKSLRHLQHLNTVCVCLGLPLDAEVSQLAGQYKCMRWHIPHMGLISGSHPCCMS